MSGFSMRQLGKTGLRVSPLGIGGGGGISAQDLLFAFEHGINYFFFSSDLHHFAYQRSVEGLKKLVARGSSVRDQVVLATVTYLNHPEKLPSILIDQFAELDIDYIDVFRWGWVTDETDMLPLLKKSHRLKGGDNIYIRGIRQMQEQASEINAELLRRGLVRYVGASFHSRRAACIWMKNLDVLMLRCNPVHRGVEQDIVPFLSGEKARDPGIVAFKTAFLGDTLTPGTPSALNKDWPSIPDRYRFALTNPWIDVVLTGPANRVQVKQALDALEHGPLNPEEYAEMKRYGELLAAQNQGTQLADR